MEKYKAIIDLPYKKSARRPRMSMNDRAAQFAPFAALTGLDAALAKTEQVSAAGDR